MLSRDILFLRRELQIEKSKIRDLESRLNLLPADPSVTNKRMAAKRTVFVESVEEARKVKASFGTLCNIHTQFSRKLSPAEIEELQTQQTTGYQELSERLNRAEKLQLVINKREAKDKLIVSSVCLCVLVFFLCIAF